MFIKLFGVMKMVVTNVRTTIHTMKADYLTPVTIFKKLKGHQKFLLESSSKYEESGRYSFIGANPRKTYFGSNTTLNDVTHETSQHYTYDGALIQSLKQVMPRVSSNTQFPFIGGAIGYIQQDAENKIMPDVQFHIYDTVVIFDHIKDEATIVHTNIAAEHQESNLQSIIAQLESDEKVTDETFELGTLQAESVRSITSTFTGSPFELYRKLRIKAPGAYMYYVEFDKHTLIGTSKDSFIAVTEAQIQGRPSNHYKVALEKVATNVACTEKITGQLQPGLHSLDALQALIEEDEKTSDSVNPVVGYIGFNGQIDFTLGEQVIVIDEEKLLATASEPIFTAFQNTLQQLKG